MTELKLADVRVLTEEILEWTAKCEEMKRLANESTGEVADAYCLVYRDYLWKLTGKTGKLWFYLCGRDDMNPFEPTSPPSSDTSSAPP